MRSSRRPRRRTKRRQTQRQQQWRRTSSQPGATGRSTAAAPESRRPPPRPQATVLACSQGPPSACGEDRGGTGAVPEGLLQGGRYSMGTALEPDRALRQRLWFVRHERPWLQGLHRRLVRGVRSLNLSGCRWQDWPGSARHSPRVAPWRVRRTRPGDLLARPAGRRLLTSSRSTQWSGVGRSM